MWGVYCRPPCFVEELRKRRGTSSLWGKIGQEVSPSGAYEWHRSTGDLQLKEDCDTHELNGIYDWLCAYWRRRAVRSAARRVMNERIHTLCLISGELSAIPTKLNCKTIPSPRASGAWCELLGGRHQDVSSKRSDVIGTLCDRHLQDNCGC